ncbi:hypothetical protein MD535_00550 [Vibrio sp. ZSDZ65]|uniref:Lipoprotein n=1 Tax=Vibrio qingdaonensis TaxID=2829491 RepID=A0A9X3CJK7_9VIBR|nr:hypothetical protein [Vibrio qingdaonensis]MCW8344516.1 hypothetical protein [Vibrio qingdaonensis]
MKLWQGMLIILALSGCSERYYNGKGAELLVYPEQHVYEFTAKTQLEATNKLSKIFDSVDEIDSGAAYSIEYKNAKSKKLLDASLADKKLLPYQAEVFTMTRNASLASDLKVTITFHALLTKPCQPSRIESTEISRNCFSEAARSQQVAHKERLVEGI